MSEEQRQSGKSRTLHLEVVDTQTVIFERLNLRIQLRVGQRCTQFSALWTIESSTGDGDSSHHVIGGNAVEEFRIVVHAVGIAYLVVPFHLTFEFLLCVKVADFIAACIEVDESVEADTFL